VHDSGAVTEYKICLSPAHIKTIISISTLWNIWTSTDSHALRILTWNLLRCWGSSRGVAAFHNISPLLLNIPSRIKSVFLGVRTVPFNLQNRPMRKSIFHCSVLSTSYVAMYAYWTLSSRWSSWLFAFALSRTLETPCATHTVKVLKTGLVQNSFWIIVAHFLPWIHKI
jgi:hypothetical protein